MFEVSDESCLSKFGKFLHFGFGSIEPYKIGPQYQSSEFKWKPALI